MKKILVSVLLILALCLNMLALVSCNKTQKLDAFVIPEGGFDSNQEITITFYHTMGESLRNVLDQYIPEFNKLYPNIKVEHQQVGGYDDVRDTIKTEITVGNQPNIAYCYPDHVASYNLSHAVITLDDLIASELTVTRADGTTEVLGLTAEQIADFIPGYYAEGKQFGDGKMYTLPMVKSTEVLYYNKTFFDQHSLKVPTTWAEMEETCAKIIEIVGAGKCIPLGYDSEANWFITLTEQYGSDYTSATGDHFLFDNETNRGFVSMLREWYKKGYVTTQEISGGYTSKLFTQTNPNEVNCYMCIGSSAGAKNQKPDLVNGKAPFEVGITTVPQLDASKPKVISQGPSLCIFNDSNPQEVLASWLFMKYLTTTVEFQAAFGIASGYVPVLQSVSENPIYADHINNADGFAGLTAYAAKVALEQKDAYYTSPAFNGSSDARDEVGNLVKTAMITEGDAAAVIDKAFKDAIEQCKYKQLS